MRFVNKICCNYDYWCNEDVIDASINRYERFLNLAKVHSRKVLDPTMDIDLVWHTHQTNHEDYVRYCNNHLGRIFDHDDSISGADLS